MNKNEMLHEKNVILVDLKDVLQYEQKCETARLSNSLLHEQKCDTNRHEI